MLTTFLYHKYSVELVTAKFKFILFCNDMRKTFVLMLFII